MFCRHGYGGILECSVFAIPAPAAIEWMYDGQALAEGVKYEVSQEEEGEHVHKSTLTIHHVGLHDFGSYNCSVSNKIGGSFLQVELKMQGRGILLLRNVDTSKSQLNS